LRTNKRKKEKEHKAMAKRGGFSGGIPGNMNNLMKQAQRMQRQMEEGQKELETKEFSAKAGGGVVEVVVTGKKEIVKVTLSEEAVDPEDIETLQDLIMAAANEALRQAEEANNELMGKMAGGLGGLGGGLPF
jgi:DNA-binding protein, YbaB/EbfC family